MKIATTFSLLLFTQTCMGAIVSDEDLLTTVLTLEDNSRQGMEAIAEVIYNRAGHNPEKVREVLLKRYQFSCLNPHTIHHGSLVSLVRRARSRSNWRAASKIARNTLAGKVGNLVGRSTHYFVYRGTHKVSPYWGPPSLGGRNKKAKIVTYIGDHVFLYLK